MAGEKYKGKYTNDRGELVDAVGTIEYVVPGFLGGLRKALGETPTDTVITMRAEKVPYAVSQKITRTPDGVTTERFDNSTGEWIPQDHHSYWNGNSVEFMNSAKPVQSWWKQIANYFVPSKQQGGTVQQNSSIKEKVKTLIKLRKDPQKGQQAMQILGEYMQQNPEEFKTIVLELAQEDQDVAEFVQELQQASQGGTPTAAKGTKLNYVKELKGICPEGYLKTGGRCKPCEAKMKAKGGDMDPVKSFKANRKNKK